MEPRMSSVSKMRSPQRPDRPTAHQQLWMEAEDFVVAKTGVKERWKLSSLVSALILRTRDLEPGSLPTSPPVEALARQAAPLEAAFPDALLTAVQQDRVLIWLITASLIRRRLMRRNHQPEHRDPSTEKGDRLLEARGRALRALEGGQKPLAKYLENLQNGLAAPAGGFWAYLQKSVDNATIDPFRLRSFLASLWDGTGSLADERPEDGSPSHGQVAKDLRLQAERGLIRAQRAAERRRTLSLVREFAKKGMEQGDSNCRIVLEYLDWAAAQPDERRPSQADFAREREYSPGTVNSALDRFRKQLKRGPGRTLSLPELYTTHGGSVS